jgi:hypothetical protein
METPRGITLTRIYAGDPENDKVLRQKINEIIFRYRPTEEEEKEDLKKSS